MIAQNESLTICILSSEFFENFASKNRKQLILEYSKWASFYAISDLLQSWHTRRWHNL